MNVSVYQNYGRYVASVYHPFWLFDNNTNQDYDVFRRQKCDTFARSGDAVFELSLRFAEPFTSTPQVVDNQRLEREKLLFMELAQGPFHRIYVLEMSLKSVIQLNSLLMGECYRSFSPNQYVGRTNQKFAEYWRSSFSFFGEEVGYFLGWHISWLQTHMGRSAFLEIIFIPYGRLWTKSKAEELTSCWTTQVLSYTAIAYLVCFSI